MRNNAVIITNENCWLQPENTILIRQRIKLANHHHY